jgi:hypothetical protein
MNAVRHETPGLEDHEKAMTETAFLLDMFASTIHDLMGGATGSITRIAGRSMARKFPDFLNNPSMEETLQVISKRFKGGFEFSQHCGADGADLDFGKCAIRRICETRNVPLNGPLCQLFHFYLDGIVNELHHRPVKSTIGLAGSRCRVRLDSK